MNFRKQNGYHGEYFVSYTIPNTEDRDTVPCDATMRPDGSHTFTTGILYSRGDLCFARDHIAIVTREHPTWKGEVYRVDADGTTVERVQLAAA